VVPSKKALFVQGFFHFPVCYYTGNVKIDDDIFRTLSGNVGGYTYFGLTFLSVLDLLVV